MSRSDHSPRRLYGSTLFISAAGILLTGYLLRQGVFGDVGGENEWPWAPFLVAGAFLAGQGLGQWRAKGFAREMRERDEARASQRLARADG